MLNQGTNPNILFENGQSALYIAVQMPIKDNNEVDSFNLAYILLRHGADPKLICYTESNKRTTVLHLLGDYPLEKPYLNTYVDNPSFLSRRNALNELLKTMIFSSKGINPNLQDEKGYTPIMMWAFRNPFLIETLIEVYKEHRNWPNQPNFYIRNKYNETVLDIIQKKIDSANEQIQIGIKKTQRQNIMYRSDWVLLKNYYEKVKDLIATF